MKKFRLEKGVEGNTAGGWLSILLKNDLVIYDQIVGGEGLSKNLVWNICGIARNGATPVPRCLDVNNFYWTSCQKFPSTRKSNRRDSQNWNIKTPCTSQTVPAQKVGQKSSDDKKSSYMHLFYDLLTTSGYAASARCKSRFATVALHIKKMG